MNKPVKKEPHPTDVFVGQQIKNRRKLLGITQGKLSDKLGITFQQLQKYENAGNRISASKIMQISELLKANISDFFPNSNSSELLAITEQEIQLLRCFRRLDNNKTQQRVVELLKIMGGTKKLSY